MTATDELRRLLDERGVEWDEYGDGYTLFQRGGREYTVQPNVCNRLIVTNLTPEQAIAATLGSDDTFTREDVEGAFVSGYSLGLDMFDSSKPEKGWDQNKRNLDEEMEDLGWVRKDADTFGAGTYREVYLLMATDIGDGREEVLGVYATESAATKAISENQFGYALHHVRKLEVTS